MDAFDDAWAARLRLALDRLGGRSVPEAVARARIVALATPGPDAGAAGVLAAVRHAGLPDPDRQAEPSWLALSALHRLALVLVEVEIVPATTAAAFLGVPVDELLAAVDRAGRELRLPETSTPPTCPGLATVARLYRTEPEEAEIALRHIGSCGPCSLWHSRRAERRGALASIAPWCGATGLGYVLDRRGV